MRSRTILLPLLTAALLFVSSLPSPARHQQDEIERTLIPVGKPAPAFDLKLAKGGKISLPATVKTKKATLVNFWFVGCQSCEEEFKHLEKLHTNLKSKGFTMIAINDGDEATEVNKYLRMEGFTFLVALSDTGAKSVPVRYKVEAYPTNYLLDSKGKIVYRSVGYNEKGMKAALAKLGVK